MTDITSIHIERIAQAHQRLDGHDGRLDGHDSRIVRLETHSAVAAERAEHIQKSLDKLESGQSWLIRLVLGGLVMGAIAFLLAGGFHVSP